MHVTCCQLLGLGVLLLLCSEWLYLVTVPAVVLQCFGVEAGCRDSWFVENPGVLKHWMGRGEFPFFLI